VLVGPITIEKPFQDGFVTRFKPNLTRVDGTVPPVHEVHLHHGTWLALTNEYGQGPFFASGEEKTIAPFPKGYGMPIKKTDQWQLLYMVHSAVQSPMEVYITYEIDFVPATSPAAPAMKPALPLWLDVRPSSYPVFNVQRPFGGDDGKCTWPKEKCAAFNSYGVTEVGQGLPGNGIGKDLKLPSLGESFGLDANFTGGTIIGLGGHLHPGGLSNEVDLVRDGQAKRIYTGIPSYWDPADKTKAGGPPDSWDFSMRVSGLPYWGVNVEPGDVLRSNVTYDTTLQSSYENMGIVVSLLVPEDDAGNKQAPGLDPFTAPVDETQRCESGGLTAATPTLCPNGFWETHGHYRENAYRGGPDGTWSAPAGAPTAIQTSEIGIADFLYTPGDLSTASTLGVPKVALGTNLRFTNADGGGILHTITTCKFPCLGPTGAAFPIGDGSTNQGRQIDLDSGQLGYSVPEISGAKNKLDWTIPVTQQEGYKPGEIVTYFCRIHPSMRGAFEVAGTATTAAGKSKGLLGGIR
jgi:plastocyanin